MKEFPKPAAKRPDELIARVIRIRETETGVQRVNRSDHFWYLMTAIMSKDNGLWNEAYSISVVSAAERACSGETYSLINVGIPANALVTKDICLVAPFVIKDH